MAQRICVTGASGQAGRAVVTGGHVQRQHHHELQRLQAAAALKLNRVVWASSETTLGLLAIDRARQVLGFTPAHSWRDHVKPR